MSPIRSAIASALETFGGWLALFTLELVEAIRPRRAARRPGGWRCTCSLRAEGACDACVYALMRSECGESANDSEAA